MQIKSNKDNQHVALRFNSQVPVQLIIEHCCIWTYTVCSSSCLNELLTRGADGSVQIHSRLSLQSSKVAAAAAEAIRRQSKNANTDDHSLGWLPSSKPIQNRRYLNISLNILVPSPLLVDRRPNGNNKEQTLEYGTI